MPSFLKQLALSTALYRPARALYRAINRTQSERYREVLGFYSKLIDRGSLCFDVGANIGERTEALLTLGASVVAFEPQPACVRELKARCGGYKKHLHLRQTAVGNERGQAEIYFRRSSGQASLLQDWQGEPTGEKLTVPLITLDDAISEFGVPSYCKIDVEGSELNVLRGLSHPIPLLSLEYHLSEREIDATYACLTHLSQFGELSINLTPLDRLHFHFPDWLSCTEFLKIWPKEFKAREGFFYGDMFVRVTAP
jgi:FkbM family methyltransferase